MSEKIDWIALSGRKAKGKRPEYFDDPALDRLYSTVLALAAELSATRDRLDTLERTLEADNMLSREAIESYAPCKTAGEERGISTRAYIARIMRGFQQDVQAMQEDEPSIAEWADKMGRE